MLKERKTGVLYFLPLLFAVALFSSCDDNGGVLPGESVSEEDRSFALNASYSNLAEIQMGQLAASKATIEDIREFGADMVTAHTTLQTELIAVALNRSIPIPDAVSNEDGQLYNLLENLEGNSFDSAYVANQIIAHQEAQNIFQSQVDEGTNDQLKEYAFSTLPHIVAHLERAQALQLNYFPD